MSFWGIGLHVIVAVICAIHAVRNNREIYWLLILFLFPLLGSIVYILAVWIPEWRNSHRGNQLERNVKKMLTPDRELSDAQKAFSLSQTVDNRTRLAKALLNKNRTEEALTLYKEALTGMYASDPQILLEYA